MPTSDESCCSPVTLPIVLGPVGTVLAEADEGPVGHQADDLKVAAAAVTCRAVVALVAVVAGVGPVGGRGRGTDADERGDEAGEDDGSTHWGVALSVSG